MSVTVGQRFGAWVVVRLHADPAKVVVLCDCGRTERSVRLYDLTHGKSLMCRRCSVSVSKTSHGAAPYGNTSPEYNTWVHMIQRCHNPKNKDYKNYGGRGIEVCEMWRESFEAFLLMVGKRPTLQHTIERIDSNGNYEPGNVRWATRAEQNVNTRSNVKLTIDGVTQTVSEWSRDPRCTVSMFTVYKRLDRGWDARRAVFTPSKSRSSDSRNAQESNIQDLGGDEESLSRPGQ